MLFRSHPLSNQSLHKHPSNILKFNQKFKRNRRLSKAQKNKNKNTNNITQDLKYEMAELKTMKSNLRQIGVAQKLVHNLTGKTIPQVL